MLLGHHCQQDRVAKGGMMQLDDIDLLIIEVVLGVIRLVRKNEGRQKIGITSLHLAPRDLDGGLGRHFWGEELGEDGQHSEFSGRIQCRQGQDGFWLDGLVTGEIYLDGVGKCPFGTKYDATPSLKIRVSRDSGDATSYSYTPVGEFVI